MNAPVDSVRPVPLRNNRDFLFLWSGQAVSGVGSMMSSLALPLLILRVTGSAAQAGLVIALFSLPYFLLGLPAGALVDRWNRKSVMIICDIGRALALGSVAVVLWLGHLRLVQLYVAAATSGSLLVFFNVAEPAALVHVVSKEQLPAAVARNELIEPVSSLSGPPLSGLLFQAWHGLPFLADAVSYAVSAISLCLIRAQLQEERTPAPLNLRAEVVAGLTWLWRYPLVRFFAFLTGGINFVFSANFLLLIVLARRQHAPPPTVGIIFTIAAFGGLCGALMASRVQKRLSFGQAIVGVEWIMAVLFPLYAMAPNPVALGAIDAGLFFTVPIYNTVQYSYRLALVPDALQSRVNSAYRLIAYATQPVGAGLSGLLLQSVGVRPTIILFWVWLVVLALAATLNPQVRRAKPISELPAP